ncbi:alpha/beta hydrolase family protein [Hymenobacter edaphi]|uniref:Dienelactone hydrolase domain-containing protein n=1 Tax=Hymenobacter edaphi TaxID=2211146 RepID=A0A328BCX3_9BACT|nr:dienelactone hydrolase family protein [Hymenobacter edaphi]RAK62918.1 hypothetical protein DLM85_22220 [Hymenobacter edaphi]
MIRLLLTTLLVAAGFLPLAAQPTIKRPADYGYRHLRVPYGPDTVDVLILSKPGEEQRRKPLLLFVQGSLPKPLLLVHDKGTYPLFPFKGSGLYDAFHLVIISKPGIPVVADVKTLQPNFSYFDPRTQAPPLAYCQRNHLDYYVARNAAVLKYLVRQPWVDARTVVAAGHSEGSTVVAKMAATDRRLTHVVSLSGNPAGRMATMLAQQRGAEGADAAALFRYWQHVVDHAAEVTCTPADAPKTTYSFSVPPAEYLRRSRVPVLVLYGTRDAGAPFNDAFRLDLMRTRNTRVTFHDYPGLEHNFFAFKDGRINYDDYRWDEVAADFGRWVQTGRVAAEPTTRP